LELCTLSAWHSNQQVDGGHYEAEATIFIRDMCKKKIQANLHFAFDQKKIDISKELEATSLPESPSRRPC
jgi:hypothetical protein